MISTAEHAPTLHTRVLTPAVVVLAASVAATIWAAAGAAGFGDFCVYALIAAAGLPLGFALFGRKHAAGWLGGLLLGYAFVSLAWWAVVFRGAASTPAFAASWIGAAL